SAPVSFTTPLGTPGLLEFGFEESGDLRLEWQGGSFHEPSFRVESSADGGATWSLVDVVTGERAILPLTPDDAGRQYRLRAELVRPDESPAISPWAGPIEPVLSPVRFSKIDVDREHDPYSPE